MGVMKRMICLMFILTGGLKAGTHLQAQASADSTSRDQLRQLSAQLRQSPSDQALREKIIALALTMNPRPATPDDAIMAEGAAEYAFKNAKANSDFADAAKQYEKALVLAPWLAVDYFNCGVAHEKAGENKEAIQSFSLYLLAAPNSDDAVAVKKRMGGLQYAAQKADNAARDQARVANEQAQVATQLDAVYRGLDGAVWRYEEGYTWDGTSWRQSYSRSPRARWDASADFLGIHGHEISGWTMYDNPASKIYQMNPNLQNVPRVQFKTTFETRQFKVDPTLIEGVRYGSYQVTISADGQSITVEASEENVAYRRVFQRIK